MPEHWTAIGRRLSVEVEGWPKAERAAHLKEAARVMGFAPHTVGRFVVLSKFLHQLGVSDQDAVSFPVGTVEVIARIHDRDRARAAQLVAEFNGNKITYDAAYAILKKLGNRGHNTKTPPEDMERVRSVVKEHAFPTQEIGSIDLISKPSRFRFKGDSLWTCNNQYACFLSETYREMYDRSGIKKMHINVILCSSEHDFVIIEFSDEKSRSEFYSLINHLKTDIRGRIKDGGVSTRETQ